MNKRYTISNGALRVQLDEHGLVRDLFVPSARPASFTPQTKHRLGVRVDGVTSWVDDGLWSAKTRRNHNAPVNGTVLVNEAIGILLELEDVVAPHADIFMRNVHVVNLCDNQRRVSIFFHQAYVIDSPLLPDTAQHIPKEAAILHYGSRRAFVVTGMTDIGSPPDQHSVGLFGDGLDGTWRDAEDGELSGSDVACGQVDSTLRFSLTIGGLSSRRVYYWVSTSVVVREAVELRRTITLQSVFKQTEQTVIWWRKWLTPAFRLSERLQPRYRQDFIHDVSNIRLQQDQTGAIITDRQTAYCNPRDAAYALWPLIRLGYYDEPLRFFSFCRSILDENGCLLSRYAADGSIGASAHAYHHDKPPVQSDGTAIVLFVFSQFYALTKQKELLDDFYELLIKPMAKFLTEFVDEDGLPLSSYDFADKQLGVYTYTTAVTVAALTAGADIAEVMNDQEMAVSWRTVAEEMRTAAEDHMHSERGTIRHGKDDDHVSIASLFGVFMFGLFDPEEDTVEQTIGEIEREFRREDGLFACDSDKKDIDYVGSLWMAQYYIEVNRRDDAYRVVQGIIDERTEGTSQATWVCAEIVSTLLDTTYRT